MFDHVQRRRLAIQPAREDALELTLGIANVDLDERAGERLHFPRRGRLAGAQPHDDVADPHRLAGTQREIAREAVALVEEPEHGDSLRHGRRPRLDIGHRLRDVHGLDHLVVGFDIALRRTARAAAACDEQSRHDPK